jgi:hypothetical protein
MFAFCQDTYRHQCGFTDDGESEKDMTIKAGLSPETISSDQIKYKRGRGREADACFYEITPIALTDDERTDLLGSEFDTVSINLKVL